MLHWTSNVIIVKAGSISFVATLGLLLGIALVVSVFYSFSKGYEPEMDYKQSNLRWVLSGVMLLVAALNRQPWWDLGILLLCFGYWTYAADRAQKRVEAFRDRNNVDLEK